MKSLLQRLRSYFGAGVWDEDLGQLPFWRAAPLRLIRDAALVVRGYREHQLGIRSAALTYITVLSLVPMLAFAFSVAKGFGLYDRLIDDVVIEFLDTYFGEEEPPQAEDEVADLVPDDLEGTFVGDLLVDQMGAAETGAEADALGEAAAALADDPLNSSASGQELPEQLSEAAAQEALGAEGTAEVGPESETEVPAALGQAPGLDEESALSAGAAAGTDLDVADGANSGGAGESDAVVESTAKGEFDPLADPGATEAVPAQPSQVRAAINQVLAFVENADVTSLGVTGLIVLFAAVLRLLGQVEAALNMIWGIAKPRPFLRKLTDYLAMVVVAPILALTATGAKASTNSSELMEGLRELWGVGGLLEALFSLAPLFVMWLVFTLLYLVMPNTRVRPFSAILGGFVAALVWSGVQELYVKSQVGVSSYNQLYAGFAAFPLFLLWAYLSWLSMLIGAEFAHADQSQAAFRRTAMTRNSSAAYFEAAILAAVARIAERFEYGGEPIAFGKLVDAVEIPEHTLRDGFDRLVEVGLLVEAQESTGLSYVLGRAADRIRVYDVLSALRGSYPTDFAAGQVALDQRVAEAARKIEVAQAESEANQTLRELVAGQDSPEAGQGQEALA